MYRVETCTEQKKDIGWKFSRLQKTLFYFDIIPKHQQLKEIFACETEDHRNVEKRFDFKFFVIILL